MSKASFSLDDKFDFLNSLKPEDLKIFNLSSRALFHSKLKKFSEEPKLFVDLCQVKSDLRKRIRSIAQC